jgi:8-oxo-dGTP pyrophosphatase MutT (NUDIX family)
MAMAPDDYYVKPSKIKTRTGAGGVIARRDDKTGQVLIALIRSPGDSSFVLPKGGVDDGESIEQAARREIEEEAGFTKLKNLGELGVAERLNARRTTWQTTHYLLFATEQTTATPTEHRDWDVAWFGLDKLPPMYWREQKQLIEDNRRKISERVSRSK